MVNGASRFIGDIFGNKAQLTTLEAPISAGDSKYGPGTNGQVLKSNGSSLYWGTGGGGEYLTCSTAAGTAAKVITKDGFALTVGTSVFVVFSNTNTVNNPTLNINETGAKAIYYNGARVIYQGLAKDIIYHLVYDGTQWQVINTIKPEIGICSTSGSSAGKTVTCPGFTLFNGAIAHIIFSNQNSHATPTLNINSTGAKAINCVGATTKNEYRFGGGNHVYTLMYDGAKYNILQEDIRHYFSRGKSAVLYTQEEYDAYVAENGENPTWNVGDVKTAAVEGVEQISLGNYITSNTDNGMTGRLLLCSGGTSYTRILAQNGYSKDFYLPKYNGDMYAVHVGNNNAVGTSTEPVYIVAGGRATKGDKYAGGTAVTLNNASKAKTTASFYAPTAGGANNTQALVGAGTTTAPKWVNISTTLTHTAGTASNASKLKVTVLGQASSEIELTKATTGLYGMTKLTDAYTSTDATLATTGKSILAAIQTLDVDAVGVAAATGNKFISQISETDGKISAAVSTATLGSTSLPVWVDGGVIKTITSYEGTAAKATADASGNNIADTYLTKAAGVTDVTVDNSTRKLQKTINGTVSDVTTLVFVPGTGDYSGIGGQTGSDTCTASGKYSLAYGKAAKATAQNAISIGLQTEATGVYSIALGGRNSAMVTPLGTSTTTNTTAAGTAAIAAGLGCVAEGGYSVALGLGSYAKGLYSVAFGSMSYAYSDSSTVIGKANVIDTEGKYALIIGNGKLVSGSPYTRNPSNAFTVAWTGNVETAGALLPMTTNALDIGSSTQKWNDVYANEYYGDGTNITLGTASQAVVTDANQKLITVDLSVTAPTADGSTTSFIDSITQDATGKISATKKNLDTSGTWSGTAAKATKATAANIATTANAVACYSDTNGTFAAISNNTTSTQKFLSQTNGGRPTWTTIPEQLSISQASTGSYYVTGYSGTGTSLNYYTGVTINNGVLYGAAWNDYAEFRSTESVIEAGRCIKENGNDTLSLTTKRLERGCEIVSDTYGFAIGETTKCKTPVAVTGRVLAYPYEPREVFALHIGEPVCSGPNGTVSIMTEEEEEKYPSRIIGIISAVPDYEQWGTGDVEVNGRVWIRIK